MKVIISRPELIAIVGKIQNVVSPKPTLPILANVLIEAIDDQIIISVTDLVVSMRAYAEAKVIEEGSITLPARRFFQLVRELTVPQIEIHTSSPEIATINAGSSRFKIHGMHKNEFPSLPDLSDGVRFTLPAITLKELLSRAAFAAAHDDSRPVLNGVLLQHVEQVATLLSTDGKRLAKVHTPIDLPQGNPGAYVLPVKAIEEMVRIIEPKEEGLATLTLMSDKIALELKTTTLITKLIAGQYPDVDRVIPRPLSHPVTLHREELITLLRQLLLFTPEGNHSVRFTFLPGALHLSVASGEVGEGNVQMPANYGGEKLDIAFNPTYLLDILRHVKDETIHLHVTDSHNPGLITDSTTAQFMLMPMRLE